LLIKDDTLQRQLLLAQLKRPRLPAPSEIGQIATAQPVQPGGQIRALKLRGIKISDVEVGEKRKYLVRDVPNTVGRHLEVIWSLLR
jgi:hypothetical protein